MWLKYALLVIGVVHLIFGIFALYAPAQVAGAVGLAAVSPGGLGELRAAYGGLVAAVGILVLRGSMGGSAGKQWLLAVAVLFSGLAAGRIVSLAGDGMSFQTLLSLVVEGGLAAFLFYAVNAADSLSSGSAQPPMDPVDGIEDRRPE